MEKQDKIKNIILICLAVIVVVGGSYLVSSNKTTTTEEESIDIAAQATEESAAIDPEKMKEHTEITIDEYFDLLEGSEKSIILISSPTCSYCEIAEPIIKNVAFENDIKINYLNVDELSSDEEVEFVNSSEIFSAGYGTPTIFIVQNNETLDAKEGLSITDEYIEFFSSNGFIEE